MRKGNATEMSNPFATGTAPAGNPFGGGTPAAAPAETPAAAPATAAPATAAPATSAPTAVADPFGDTPPAPEIDGINSDDAAAGIVVVLKINKHEENIASSFKDPKTGEVVYQNRLTVDVLVVTGPKAGKVYADQWIFWNRVCAQFKDRAGDGKQYLVKLGKVGRAVITEPVTDPAIKNEPMRIMGLIQ